MGAVSLFAGSWLLQALGPWAPQQPRGWAAAGPVGKRRPQRHSTQAVKMVCPSMVCVRMVCVSTPSRNLASPETVQYCSTIQGRLELLDSGDSGGSGKALALAATPIAGSRARKSRRPAGRRVPHMPRPTQSRRGPGPARRSRRRNPPCGAG